LALTFGVTIYAISTVVAAFMGGLALGSFLGGRLADRVKRPILWYAGAEIVVGLMGLASPSILAWVQATYVALYPHDASEGQLAIIALRFLLSAVVLLIPTTLMGATLPLMVKSSLTISQKIGPRISFLYAANTTGAILGTLGAGFVLIGGVGISGTIWAAAVLNGLAASPPYCSLLGPAQWPPRVRIARSKTQTSLSTKPPFWFAASSLGPSPCRASPPWPTRLSGPESWP